MEFRLLKANEIDCRIATINDRGLSLLLYKDARVDQSILDEAVGAENWQRSHQSIDGRLYCTISIWDEKKGQWISKQDVGTESFAEKEKGQASDSFKRAGFNWGIGRELYTAPFIWISAEDAGIKDGSNGKKVCYDRFYVEQIIYSKDKEIVALSIKNARTDKRVFTIDKRPKQSKEKER